MLRGVEQIVEQLEASLQIYDVFSLTINAELRCSKCTNIWSSKIRFDMNIDDLAYDGVLAVADWSDQHEENLTYHQCFPALDRLRTVKKAPYLVYADCDLCDADRWIGIADWNMI